MVLGKGAPERSLMESFIHVQKKRGDVGKILEVLHFHGAQDEILIDAHPHIGTNVLPRVITSIRQSILNAGGEIHFNARVTDLIINKNEVKGVVLLNGETFEGIAVVLATRTFSKRHLLPS